MGKNTGWNNVMQELTAYEKEELLRLVKDALDRNVLGPEDRLAILKVCAEAVNRKIRQTMIELNRKDGEA